MVMVTFSEKMFQRNFNFLCAFIHNKHCHLTNEESQFHFRNLILGVRLFALELQFRFQSDYQQLIIQWHLLGWISWRRSFLFRLGICEDMNLIFVVVAEKFCDCCACPDDDNGDDDDDKHLHLGRPPALVLQQCKDWAPESESAWFFLFSINTVVQWSFQLKSFLMMLV